MNKNKLQKKENNKNINNKKYKLNSFKFVNLFIFKGRNNRFK